MNTGKVYLIGAGPGDPGLLTIHAYTILQKADIIIYDYLVNIAIIQDLSCEKIYVGKKSGQHTYDQSEINRLIIEKVQSYNIIVRLKGGDPFIFGRGGEEAEALVRNNISFEVIPGISSFYAAATYAGIPLTHRDYAQSFEVITGHRRKDTSQCKDIVFPEYNPYKTYVFMMGMKNLAAIVSVLIKDKEFPSHLPTAIIYRGTLAEQQIITASLKDIAMLAKEKKLVAPAIIIIGKVVSLRTTLQWYEKRPLAGKKIVITRTRKQASKLSQRLYELGAEPIEFPVIEIRPKDDMDELLKAIEMLPKYEWIIFTSQNAVHIFFAVLQQACCDSRGLSLNQIAAIGPVTEEALRTYGIIADLLPSSYIAEGLLEAFQHIDLRGKHILLPCSSEARSTLMQGLEKRGAIVERIHVYDTVLPARNEEIHDMERISNADMITFTSSSTVHNFFKIIDPGITTICAAIGPITGQTLQEYDRKAEVMPSDYTVEGLIEAIIAYYKR
jgi:uroporphyrinogen III methyltransferase / synthase